MTDLWKRHQINPVLLAILAITAVALIARLTLLGTRVAHWDEGRVGYDILRYLATGVWEYRPIVHGPFLPHVNRFIFSVVGANDFTARFIVALVGGTLPLATWLYRDHLRTTELLALAFFLAADPLLLYYSRFMRNDVLLATFIFFALGFLLRAHATQAPRYLYAATIPFGLAFTTKGNVILYPLATGAALLLLLDHRLFLARTTTEPWQSLFKHHVTRVAHALWRWRLHLTANTIVFLAIIVFFYAPRGTSETGLDLIRTATIGSADKLVSLWLFGSMQDHAYLPYLGHYLYILATAAGGLIVLATIGFISDRYTNTPPRDLIGLGFYWGILSIIGYPIAIDIRAPWSVVPAILPLTIPAAAGAHRIYTWGTTARDENDQFGSTLAFGILLLISLQILGMGLTTSYLHPQDQDNILVQYAQPAGDLKPALAAIHDAATETASTDVLWYGEHFYLPNESAADNLPVGGGSWYHRLPLPWYLERYNATVDSVRTPDQFESRYEDNPPPVIITCTGSDACPSDEELTNLTTTLSDHQRYDYLARQHGLTYTIYIHDTYAPNHQN